MRVEIMKVDWDLCWGESRSTKPCFCPCKVASAGDGSYRLCATGAAAVVLTAIGSSSVFCIEGSYFESRMHWICVVFGAGMLVLLQHATAGCCSEWCACFHCSGTLKLLLLEYVGVVCVISCRRVPLRVLLELKVLRVRFGAGAAAVLACALWSWPAGAAAGLLLLLLLPQGCCCRVLQGAAASRACAVELAGAAAGCRRVSLLGAAAKGSAVRVLCALCRCRVHVRGTSTTVKGS